MVCSTGEQRGFSLSWGTDPSCVPRASADLIVISENDLQLVGKGDLLVN